MARRSPPHMLLVFDLDGVLRFTSSLHEEGLRVACEEVGISQEWVYSDVAGLSTMAVFDHLVTRSGGTFSEKQRQLFREKKRLHSANLLPLCELNWGLIRELPALAKDFRLAIFTGASRESTANFLSRVGTMSSLFDRVWVSEWDFGSKFEATSFTRLSQQTGLDPSDIWLFDDSAPVLQAARRVSINACHVYGDTADVCELLPACISNCVKLATSAAVREVVQAHG